MATLDIPSNVKCITSGQVPTTEKLKDGEFAFGKVGGVAKLYGNVNGVIIDFTGDGGGGGGGTIDANTLIALLLGSNGIAIAKNAAGDKVEVKLAIPETGPITLASTHVPRPAILINVEQGGPPHAGGISCSREVGGETTYVGPAGIMIDDGAYVLSINNANDSFIAYGDIHGMPLGQALISGGPKGNVKTLFGNRQSIYGSGNIDLYRHTVWFTVVSGSSTIVDCVLTVISSSNVAVDSLTDLFSVVKPMVSSDGTYPANGRVYNTSNNKYYTLTRIYPTSGGAMIGNTQDEEKWFSWTVPGTWTFQDKVTTV